MELIKNVDELRATMGVFIGSVKESWAHATLLAVSAVEHYHDNKDASWIAEVAESLMQADGSYISCFEKMLYATTNVKLRLDEDNLGNPVKAVHKGNLPEGWREVLASVKKEGLRRYEKSVRTKNRAATFNRDGAKAPEKAKTSVVADVTSLELTEVGKDLVGAATTAAKLEGDAAVKAKALADKFKADMALIAEGKEPESRDPASLGDAELDALVAETLANLSALSKMDVQKNGKTGRDKTLAVLTHIKNDSVSSLQAYKLIEATLAAAQDRAA